MLIVETYRANVVLLNKDANHDYVLDNPITSDGEYNRRYHTVQASVPWIRWQIPRHNGPRTFATDIKDKRNHFPII
jgi:hypothetical protein